MKKPPQKVAYLSRNSVVSRFFISAQTAKMADFMFQNMAYRATGGFTMFKSNTFPQKKFEV